MRDKLLTATLFAATIVPGGQADEPAPEKQVAALSEQHRQAAIKGDTDALDAVLADDWVVVGPTGAVETKRQQEKKIKDKTLVFEAIDPKKVKVRGARRRGDRDGPLPHQGDRQRKDGRWRLPQHRGLHQAGGDVAVRLQSSHPGGGPAGREALTAVGGGEPGWPHRAPGRPPSNGTCQRKGNDDVQARDNSRDRRPPRRPQRP